MSVELTDREHQIIQQLILDRWNPHRINKKIANHHGLTINQVKYMRSKPAFKAEYDKQLAIYLDSFDDIQLADRKERVKAMAGLYEKIPNPRRSAGLKRIQCRRRKWRSSSLTCGSTRPSCIPCSGSGSRPACDRASYSAVNGKT